MRLLRRANSFSLLLCFTAGLTAFAQGEDDSEEYREAFIGGKCPIHAIIAVEVGDARQRFEDFERQVMRDGLVGNAFPNPEVVEHRVGAHLFETGLTAYQTLFVYLTKKRLAEGQGRVSGHAILEEMRVFFGEPLQKNLLFPPLQKIGIDSSLTWENASVFTDRGFGYLERPGRGGHGLRKFNDGTIYAVARIEGELFFYLYQNGFAGPRKGRLGVFEWRKPHKPVGRPEHVALFWKYFADNEISIFPES